MKADRKKNTWKQNEGGKRLSEKKRETERMGGCHEKNTQIDK